MVFCHFRLGGRRKPRRQPCPSARLGGAEARTGAGRVIARPAQDLGHRGPLGLLGAEGRGHLGPGRRSLLILAPRGRRPLAFKAQDEVCARGARRGTAGRGDERPAARRDRARPLAALMIKSEALRGLPLEGVGLDDWLGRRGWPSPSRRQEKPGIGEDDLPLLKLHAIPAGIGEGQGEPELAVANSFTLVGLRADGVSLAIDFVPEGVLVTALDEARSFLAAHDSCSTVEVWAEGELVARVTET